MRNLDNEEIVYVYQVSYIEDRCSEIDKIYMTKEKAEQRKLELIKWLKPGGGLESEDDIEISSIEVVI